MESLSSVFSRLIQVVCLGRCHVLGPVAELGCKNGIKEFILGPRPVG